MSSCCATLCIHSETGLGWKGALLDASELEFGLALDHLREGDSRLAGQRPGRGPSGAASWDA